MQLLANLARLTVDFYRCELDHVAFRVAVIGGGIGGLVAAIALSREGHDVAIYERVSALHEVGAAVSIFPNALAALSCIGLEAAATERGTLESSGGLRSSSGAILSTFDPAGVRAAFGGPFLMVRRPALQAVLIEALGEVPVHLNSRCVNVDVAGRPRVVFADGLSIDVDLVVGADGIRSEVRRAIFPSEMPLRYSGMASFRAIIEPPSPVPNPWLSIGPGGEFLVSPLPDGQVYVAGAIRAPEGQIRSVGGIGPFIRDSYSRFDHPVLELIDHISEEQYIVDDLYDRDPPKSLHRGHVVVIGDAAHPMTPDLGQGACQAIEDGVLLASCMSHEVEVSLLRFERLRLRRVARIVRESRRLGDICTSTNRTFAVVRNAVLRLSPSALTVRHLAAFNSRDAFEAQLKSE